MPPYQGGGEMIETVTCDTIRYNDPPYRFEAGTPPIAEAAALTAALDYIDSIGKDRIRAHETDLRRYAEERLKPINSLRFIGHAAEKGAIISFTMEGAHAHDVATILDRSGIAVRAGTHCAEPLLARFGLTATCRASFGLYNTRAEVEALAEGLQKAERFLDDRDHGRKKDPSRARRRGTVRKSRPRTRICRSHARIRLRSPRNSRRAPIPEEELERITQGIVAALKTVYDPEIPVDIYELGLIYRIDINDDREVDVEMTLTAPGCPVAGDMPAGSRMRSARWKAWASCGCSLCSTPPWDPSRMSDEARVALKMF